MLLVAMVQEPERLHAHLGPGAAEIDDRASDVGWPPELVERIHEYAVTRVFRPATAVVGWQHHHHRASRLRLVLRPEDEVSPVVHMGMLRVPKVVGPHISQVDGA